MVQLLLLAGSEYRATNSGITIILVTCGRDRQRIPLLCGRKQVCVSARVSSETTAICDIALILTIVHLCHGDHGVF